MNKSILSFISILSLTFMTACSGSSGGIGAPPNSGQTGPQPPTGEPCAEVELTWQPPTENVDGTPLTDLAGYNIYIGFQSGVYAEQLELNDPSLEETILEGLEFGREYYIVMTALNAQGDESAYSNQVLKQADTCPAVIDFARPRAHY